MKFVSACSAPLWLPCSPRTHGQNPKREYFPHGSGLDGPGHQRFRIRASKLEAGGEPTVCGCINIGTSMLMAVPLRRIFLDHSTDHYSKTQTEMLRNIRYSASWAGAHAYRTLQKCKGDWSIHRRPIFVDLTQVNRYGPTHGPTGATRLARRPPPSTGSLVAAGLSICMHHMATAHPEYCHEIYMAPSWFWPRAGNCACTTLNSLQVPPLPLDSLSTLGPPLCHN